MGQTMEKELKKKNSREENDKLQVVEQTQKERDKANDKPVLMNGKSENQS
jgi:hypothetical protein